ncbi:membrane-associated peptidase [Escherichia coli]|nr:membrane-associated peptidase [Escherichia coli]
MTFIVVGDIDSKEALALIKDNLSKLPANKAAENRVWPTKAENHLRFNIINDKEKPGERHRTLLSPANGTSER